jgi:signal transduction histidine kinase
VDLVEDNNQVVIKVKDHGIGIPMDEIPLLFTPFFRASNTGNIAGTGLGLNIVLEAVHRHRGTIDVESRINDGTTFTIRLPKQINRN